MAQERVEQALKNLEEAIDYGRHHCEVAVEDLGNFQEVAFYLDGGEDPVYTLVVHQEDVDDPA